MTLSRRRMISWREFEDMCKFLAERLKRDLSHLPEYPYMQLIAISRGGTVPAVMLSHILKMPIKRTVHVSTYSDTTNKNLGAHILNAPGIPDDEIGISIFVDDILDTGTTIKAVRNLYGDARFVMPIGKTTGVSLHLDHLVVRPPFVVDDECWVHFPWEPAEDSWTK